MAKKLQNVLKDRKLLVFDNGGRTADRYTVIIKNQLYLMSSDANMPNGVNIYSGNVSWRDWDAMAEGTFGKEISFEELPEGTKIAIRERLTEERLK